LKSRLKKKINRAVGKAVNDYSMISDNDKILVGISGGKDSQTLLNILYSFQKKAPVNFDILPVYLDPGFESSFAEKLDKYTRENFGQVIVEYTDHGIVAHSEQNRKNPCFLCSRFRRKRLFEIAAENGCKKVALGHNKDDLIETFFINIFYAGKIATMIPKQSFFDGKLDIIRPLAYVEENDILAFHKACDIPVFINTCPSANVTKRSEIRNLLKDLYQGNSHIKGNIFKAMGNIATDYMLKTNYD
jgi:tRNA 2-thiocytidine biosynthesis protein TtcA